MLQPPINALLAAGRRVLVAGAGGGFDVFCGLPLYFALQSAGKEVFLANLSFTTLALVKGHRPHPALVEVTADTEAPRAINYFPEGYLARWFRRRGEEVTVHCFERTGVVPLRQAYQGLVERSGIDTLLLVDGGTDSLMRGDEDGLGTPHEDVASLAASYELPLERKALLCLGFGVDTYHGVCHARFLEAVAELTREGAYLGAFSLTPEMPEVQLYREATRAVVADMPRHPSIVNSSILSAVEGHYGDHHATERTAGSILWINPLMGLFWCFRLEAVARRVLYLEEMKRTECFDEVRQVIVRWLALRPPPRPWDSIPV
jgi:hypothetical protein